MKYIITILLLFNVSLKAQTHDTIPQYIPVLDTTHYWNYYNKNGSLAWGQVKGYDPTLIPVGGKAVKQKIVDATIRALEGFVVIQSPCCGGSVTIACWDGNKKPITKPLIVAGFYFPVDGFNFREITK